MKTRTPVILTALLAGAVVAAAHPHPYRQAAPYQRQGPEQRQYGSRQGQRQFQGRHRDAQQYQSRGQRDFRHPAWQRDCPQGRQKAPGPQGRQGPERYQREQRSDPRAYPGQREQRLKRRDALFQHFDQDGDGRLSQQERKAARQAVQKRLGNRNPGEQTPKRPENPRGEE